LPLRFPSSITESPIVLLWPWSRLVHLFSFLVGFQGFPGQVLAEMEPALPQRWGDDLEEATHVISGVETTAPTAGEAADMILSRSSAFSSVVLRFFEHYLAREFPGQRSLLQLTWVYGRSIHLLAWRNSRGYLSTPELQLLHLLWIEEWRKVSRRKSPIDGPDLQYHSTATENPGNVQQQQTTSLILLTEFYVAPSPDRNRELQSILVANVALSGVAAVILLTFPIE
jgi:hypothetical protein